MYLKGFLLSILLTTKLTLVNASLNCFEFPEKFDSNYPEIHYLIQTLEISPKAVKLFEKVKAEHGTLNVKLANDCATNGYYTQGTNEISISNAIINSVESFCETFLWEVCNSINKYLKLTDKFYVSKDEYAFFTEAAEHKSCTRSLKILNDYFNQAKNIPELKEKIEYACGESIESLIDENENDPTKQFKNYWKNVNQPYVDVSFTEKTSHAQLYRIQCNIDNVSIYTFNEDRKYFTALNERFFSTKQILFESIKLYEAHHICSKFTIAAYVVENFLEDKKSYDLIKLIEYAFKPWAFYEEIPYLPNLANNFYQEIIDNKNDLFILFNNNYDLICKGVRYENPAKVFVNPIKFKENSERFAARTLSKKTRKVYVDPVKFIENSKRFKEHAMMKKMASTQPSTFLTNDHGNQKN